jgi:hypothetical protein
MRFLRLPSFLQALELFGNPLDLLPRYGPSNSAASAPLSRRWARFTIAPITSRSRISSAAGPAGIFSYRCVLKNSGGSSRMLLRIAADPPAPGRVQLAGFARVAVMFGKDSSHPLAVLQALPGGRHQKLHRHLGRDLALAHLLLDGLRQKLHQRQPPRHPAHATVEPPRQLLRAVAETLLQLS